VRLGYVSERQSKVDSCCQLNHRQDTQIHTHTFTHTHRHTQITYALTNTYLGTAPT